MFTFEGNKHLDRFEQLKARVEHELARATLHWKHPVSRVFLDFANDVSLATRERNGGHTAYAMHILTSIDEFLNEYRLEVTRETIVDLAEENAWEARA